MILNMAKTKILDRFKKKDVSASEEVELTSSEVTGTPKYPDGYDPDLPDNKQRGFR